MIDSSILSNNRGQSAARRSRKRHMGSGTPRTRDNVECLFGNSGVSRTRLSPTLYVNVRLQTENAASTTLNHGRIYFKIDLGEISSSRFKPQSPTLALASMLASRNDSY